MNSFSDYSIAGMFSGRANFFKPGLAAEWLIWLMFISYSFIENLVYPYIIFLKYEILISNDKFRDKFFTAGLHIGHAQRYLKKLPNVKFAWI